jgi:sulfur-carrier protein
MITLLYFAWVRERIGTGEEQFALPEGVTTTGMLLDWLTARSPRHAEALAERTRIRMAVNQDYVDLDHLLRDGDEIALFPPVTGG